MRGLRFVKPSVVRVFWSIIAAIAICCLIAGLSLFIGGIATDDDRGATSTGDYIRLFFVFIMIWGPGIILIAWKFSVPFMIGLGWLAASVRRVKPPLLEVDDG